jgi:hypothetical protein
MFKVPYKFSLFFFSTNFVTFSIKDWEICGNFSFSSLNSFTFAKFIGEKNSPNFRYHHPKKKKNPSSNRIGNFWSATYFAGL